MTIIDPSTNEGKLRLAVADWSDIPILPSSVYQQVLLDNDNDLVKSTKTLGSYILGIFSQKTHRKLGLQLEVWGGEQFDQYKKYLLLILKDPAFGLAMASPLPYATTSDFSPIPQFIADFRRNFSNGDESQQLATDASISPNLGDLYGPTGAADTGWQLT